MEWISVEKQRPPQNVYVLVAKWDGRTKVNMHFIRIASRIGDGWIDDHDGELLEPKYGVITHWMPLPRPPDKI